MASTKPGRPASAESTRPADDSRPVLIVAHDDLGGITAEAGWRWFEADFPELRWVFLSSAPSSGIERRFPRASLLRTRYAWQVVALARREKSALLITSEPEITYRCALLARFLRVRFTHFAWAFNFGHLPEEGLRRRLMRSGFRSVDRFVISSAMERQRYARAFGIPPEKFDLHLWSVGEPEVSQPESPVIEGDYICALGSNSRDYRTLVEAMRELPEIRLIVVARPDAIAGLNPPPNVEVRSGIPQGLANNILAFSRFMVLPLADGQTPNGHVTLVNSMKLSRAAVVTESEGIADYVRDGVDAITCAPGSSASMAAAIRSLWDDRTRSERLGEAARAFAETHCSEAAAKNQFRDLLIARGLIAPDRPVFR